MTVAALGKHTELGGRYRLTNRIATGGMGEVWRAEDTLLHRKVAVKVLKSELTSDPTFLERFRAEARNTAALSHPGIAAIHDYGETDHDDQPTAYLVMELVEGEPLSAILAREGRLTPQRVLRIVGQAATALEAAHQTGMVHRDVKPGNLLVAPGDTVKITDFGIARVAESVPLTQAGMVVGTAQYFAPEQAEGKPTTPASDVYSLAVVAYECLAGRLPFEADSSVAVAVMQIRNAAPPLPEDVPPPVRAVVARGMAKDPALRFATGGEFAAALQAFGDAAIGDATKLMTAPPPLNTQLLPGPVSGHTPMPPGAPTAPPLLGPPPGLASGLPPMAGPSSSGAMHASALHHATGMQPSAAPRRRGRALLAVVLLTLLAVATTVAVLTMTDNDETGSGQPSSRNEDNPNPVATATSPAGPPEDSPGEPLIHVDMDLYRGQDVKDACQLLTKIGLRPSVEHDRDLPGRSGTVIDVRPGGDQYLPRGSAVVLVVAGPGPDCKINKEDDD